MLNGPITRLHEEIRAAEQRVVESDVRLNERWRRVRHDAARALTGKAMAGAGLLAAGWLMRGARRRRPPAADLRRVSMLRRLLPVALHRGLPLLLPLLTPLLDRRVTNWLSHFGLPVGAPREAAPLMTARSLDPARLAGVWHEIAHLPGRGDRRMASDVVTYLREHDGGYILVERGLDARGRVQQRAGILRVPDPVAPAQMELTHAPPWLRWFPGAWSDHHVIYVDAEHSCMLVGTPDRDGLWLLARDPWLPDAARGALVSLAAKLGFPVTRLRMTPQSSSPSEAAEATPTPSAKAA